MATDASGERVYHVLALFTARHPHWPAYEARMTAFADVRGLQPVRPGAPRGALHRRPSRAAIGAGVADLLPVAKRVAENPNPSGTAHTLTALNLSSRPAMYALAAAAVHPKG